MDESAILSAAEMNRSSPELSVEPPQLAPLAESPFRLALRTSVDVPGVELTDRDCRTSMSSHSASLLYFVAFHKSTSAREQFPILVWFFTSEPLMRVTGTQGESEPLVMLSPTSLQV